MRIDKWSVSEVSCCINDLAAFNSQSLVMPVLERLFNYCQRLFLAEVTFKVGSGRLRGLNIAIWFIALRMGSTLFGLPYAAWMLTAAMEEAVGGNLKIEIPALSTDELGEMDDSFNKMMVELNQAYQDLNREVNERKMAKSRLFENE